MARRTSAGRRRAGALALGLLPMAALAGACGSQTDAEPTVASVNFEPRVVVTVAADGITAAAGEREGATTGDGDVDVVTRTGSVVELHNDADDSRRILITRTGLGAEEGAEPSVWLDTGAVDPGDTVVLALSAAGDYAFADITDDDTGAEPDAVVRVEPAAT